jgi:hypothetical protein
VLTGRPLGTLVRRAALVLEGILAGLPGQVWATRCTPAVPAAPAAAAVIIIAVPCQHVDVEWVAAISDAADSSAVIVPVVVTGVGACEGLCPAPAVTPGMASIAGPCAAVLAEFAGPGYWPEEGHQSALGRSRWVGRRFGVSLPSVPRTAQHAHPAKTDLLTRVCCSIPTTRALRSWERGRDNPRKVLRPPAPEAFTPRSHKNLVDGRAVQRHEVPRLQRPLG